MPCHVYWRNQNHPSGSAPGVEFHFKSTNASINTIVLMATCCLDNSDELSRKLGIPLNSPPSDEYVILRAYERWGSECTQHLLGDFSFAVWDNHRQRLFCARDAIGIKSFYYDLDAKQFIFSDHFDDILSHPDVSTRLDEPFVASYLLDKFFASTERTFFADIKKLPPGHSLTVDAETFKITRHWHPENVADVRFNSDEEYSQALLSLYSNIIPSYVGRDKKVGIELSGGLDSSSIAVLASRELKRQGRSRPFVYNWHPSPEVATHLQGQEVYDFINTVCEQEDLTPQYCFPSVDDMKLFYQGDPTRQPTASTLMFQLPIQRLAKSQGVNIILSGWGGDQCVTASGSRYCAALLKSGNLRQLYKESLLVSDNPLRFIIGTAISLVPQKIQESIRRIRKGHSLFSQPKNHIQQQFAKQTKALRDNPGLGNGNVQQSHIEMLTGPHLVERIEACAYSGARHDLVYRYPMLDRRLLEFGLGLPPEQFLRGKTRRWVARNAFDSILPKSVCWNMDKSDHLLFGASMENILIVLSEIADTLGDKQFPKHTKYVDINSLVSQLKSDSFKASPKLGQITHAMLFLNSEL